MIADGRAEVLVNGASVRQLGRADCFGEIAALTGRRRTSTVRANIELRLLRFDGPNFLRAVTGYTPSNAAASTLAQERLAHAASSAGMARLPSRVFVIDVLRTLGMEVGLSLRHDG